MDSGRETSPSLACAVAVTLWWALGSFRYPAPKLHIVQVQVAHDSPLRPSRRKKFNVSAQSLIEDGRI